MKTIRGFTLIELVIVIVILGILAAIAIPRYVDLSVKAKEASVKGSLGGMRAAVAVYYASRAAYNQSPLYPASSDDVKGALVHGIPKNPYDDSSVMTTTASAQGAVGSETGWYYKSTDGSIWANSSKCATTPRENEW